MALRSMLLLGGTAYKKTGGASSFAHTRSGETAARDVANSE